MADNSNLNGMDRRQYYQLVQENVAQEIDGTSGDPTSTAYKRYKEVDDLDLKISNSWQGQNGTVVPRRVKLKYFDGDTEREKLGPGDIDEPENDTFGAANGDGHYIVDDDAWSDYWEGGGDDVHNAIPIYISSAINNTPHSGVNIDI